MADSEDRIGELVDDIIALGTDHPNGAFPDGRKPNGTFAPQTPLEALSAIRKEMVRERISELNIILASTLCLREDCDIKHSIREDFVKARIKALGGSNEINNL